MNSYITILVLIFSSFCAILWYLCGMYLGHKGDFFSLSKFTCLKTSRLHLHRVMYELIHFFTYSVPKNSPKLVRSISVYKWPIPTMLKTTATIKNLSHHTILFTQDLYWYIIIIMSQHALHSKLNVSGISKMRWTCPSYWQPQCRSRYKACCVTIRYDVTKNSIQMQ